MMLFRYDGGDMAISYTSLITSISHAWHNGTGTITYSFLDRVPNYANTARYGKIDTDGDGTPDSWQIDSTHLIPFTDETHVALNASQQQLMQLAIARWNEVANTHITPFGGSNGGPNTAGPVAGNGTLIRDLGGSAGFGELSPPTNDDGFQAYTFAQSGLFAGGLNFYGHTYTSFYLNTNGSISFGSGISQYTPSTITSGSTPMIAPFWADVDTRVGNPAYLDFDTVNHVITATWANVGYYNQHTSPTNSFQLQLYDRGQGDFDIVFRYASINWSSGDASGGTNGLGGTPARAGYTAGDGDDTHRAELAAAGNQAAMLALDTTVGNTGQTGLWVYAVRGGQVSVGDLAFGAYNWSNDSGLYGFSYVPTGNQQTPDRNGDLWLNLGNSTMTAAVVGDDGWDTYLHELGHSLGLDHPGGVGNNPAYTSLDTVMSYNPVPGIHGRDDWPITPMVLDIQAMQQLYGANLTTRLGDTTYFGPAVTGTTGAYAMDNGGLISGSSHHMIMTIWDSGGANDWVSAANQSSDVRIDLRPGGISRIGTDFDNIRVAQLYTDPSGNKFGWIENAIGGSGNDTVIGNAIANILDGRGGNDTLAGDLGNDRFVFAPHYAADTILDFVAGAHTDDSIDLTAFHLTLASVLGKTNQSGNDTILDFGGGDTLTLKNVTKTVLNSDDFVGVVNKSAGDLTGDAKSDLLFLNSINSGIAAWQMNGAQVTTGTQIGTINTAAGWHFQDKSDFNGDGKIDLLFINGTTQGVAVWQMDGAQIAASAQVGTIGAGSHFQTEGDFNGDGKTDLLFLNDTTHSLSIWQMNGTQAGTNAQVGNVNAAAGWHFQTTGDFNGDGMTDMLLLNDTTHGVAVWQMNGSQITDGPQIGAINAAAGWHFQTTGDFNGDGKTDLLFLNDTTHALAIWQMNGTQIAASPQIGSVNAAAGWHFQDTGDFNGDGKTDLLFMNDTTHGVAIWQMNGTQIAASPQIGSINAAGGWRYDATGDYNGDNKTDLLFENTTTHALAVWLLDGQNILAGPQIGTINAAGGWHLTV